ncbi:response regulator [Rhizobium sp. CRIBSB]|nr:response regulator [Rhizobium sp. CRIBSB]
MVGLAEEPGGKINLRSIRALCVDSNAQGLEILSQTLFGFGVEKIARATTGEEAKSILTRQTVDLMLTDAILMDMSGFDLVRWLRATNLDPNRYTPVLTVTGHTQQSQILSARDCGAHFVVAKPMTPTILMQRILWVARGGRVFVESENFIGPDRRFKHVGIPNGVGRRREDLSATVGEATQPNLSQDEINDVVKPQRASL